ncbi:MAG: hypothetical protein JKY11_06035 [Alphaproteobacteria bacterium]|nr:hypothetical protein [Alphaproteobacteria bacterium]
MSPDDPALLTRERFNVTEEALMLVMDTASIIVTDEATNCNVSEFSMYFAAIKGPASTVMMQSLL